MSFYIIKSFLIDTAFGYIFPFIGLGFSFYSLIRGATDKSKARRRTAVSFFSSISWYLERLDNAIRPEHDEQDEHRYEFNDFFFALSKNGNLISRFFNRSEEKLKREIEEISKLSVEFLDNVKEPPDLASTVTSNEQKVWDGKFAELRGYLTDLAGLQRGIHVPRLSIDPYKYKETGGGDTEATKDLVYTVSEYYNNLSGIIKYLSGKSSEYISRLQKQKERSAVTRWVTAGTSALLSIVILAFVIYPLPAVDAPEANDVSIDGSNNAVDQTETDLADIEDPPLPLSDAPGIVISVSGGSKDVIIYLNDRDRYDSRIELELIVTKTQESLLATGPIAPEAAVIEATLTRALNKGEYNITILVRGFDSGNAEPEISRIDYVLVVK